MTVERRTAATELRLEDRRLQGVVMVFGDISPSHRERFLPGSLRLADVVHLDLHHDPERAVAWLPAGGLELAADDDAMRLTATLPPIPAADRAIEEVRAGTTNGLSVEFRCVKEHRESGIRVIEDAMLVGIGLVRKPSYSGSRVEARSRGRLHMAIDVLPDAVSAMQADVAGQIKGSILGSSGLADDELTEIAGVALWQCYNFAPATPLPVLKRAAIRYAGWGRRPSPAPDPRETDDTGRNQL